MKKLLLFLITCLLINLNSFAISSTEGSLPDTINDGPYIFKANSRLKVTWIKDGFLKVVFIQQKDFPDLKKKFNLLFSYKDLSDSFLLRPDDSQNYNNIDSIGVISDIHGEYDVYINLLKANGIIDKNRNWNFGKGHLVVLGDVFDRGDMVTEVLWHLFGLEKQAEKAGGKVHYILGNHELLVLQKDLRYINEKYKKAEVIANTLYFDLYSENSVLGKWLRSKPAIITINDIIFVHGGISMDLVHRNLTTTQLNRIFSTNIVGKDMEAICENEELLFLSDAKGPIWYRGYFNDQSFCETRLDSILDFYSIHHIVVGHTSSTDIKSHFKNKVFGVDAGIGINQPGEMLLYKNGSFYKCSSTGKRIKF